MLRAKFRSPGLLAIAPSAIDLDFQVFGATPYRDFEEVADGRAAVVSICGPLTHGPSFFDTYDAIRRRVQCAMADHEIVILKIDSPGGEVAGAFDCARGIRDDAAKAGKQLIAFTDAQCASAAYALACSADQIICTDTAVVGSVGVLQMRADVTQQNAMMGVGINFVTSGARKVDTNPNSPVTEEALAAIQVQVDAQAKVFFDWVGQTRSIDAEALQAGIFVGRDALAKGLVNSVMTYDELCNSVGAIMPKSPSEGNQTMPAAAQTSATSAKAGEDGPSLYKMLKAESESDDPVRAKAAKKALVAYEAADEPDGDEKDKKESDGKKAEDDAESKKAKAEADEKEAKALAGSTAALAAALQASKAEIADVKAQLKAEADARTAAERTSFIASRPDLPKETVAALEGLPLARVKEIVNAIPKAFSNPFAGQGGDPVRGKSQGGPAGAVHPAQADALDRAFGMGNYNVKEYGVTLDNGIQTFGVGIPKENIVK